MDNDLPKIIAIVGTNASGKSALGIELAKKFDGEIISADSRQIYKGFDLCCGKVTEKERTEVPHHLLDVRKIGEPFSAADFQREAYRIIPEIISRGKLPFIVGGTGLYISSVADGYVFEETNTDARLRSELEQLSLDELWGRLSPECKALLKNNPSDSKNKRRLIRMIEKTMQGQSPIPKKDPKYNVLQIGVTWDKETLYRRIDERLDKRLSQGMLNEVKDYLDGGGEGRYLEELGLEYRHIYWYLTGKYKSEEEFRSALAGEIRHFSKRQMTWFRREGGVRWLDMSGDHYAKACALIKDFLKG